MLLPHTLFLSMSTLINSALAANMANRLQPANGVSISAYDYALNLDQRVMSVDWEVLGCGEYKLQEYRPQGVAADPPQCGPLNLAVDVYFNDGLTKVYSYDTNDLPVDPILGPLLLRDRTSFRTVHTLHPSGRSAGSYTFRESVLAINPTTNSSVDIARFTITCSLDGFTTTVTSSGVGTDDGPVTMGIGPLTLGVEYHPKRSSRALVWCALVGSWALTLASACSSLVATTEWRLGSATLIFHGFTVLGILGLWEGWLGRGSFGPYLGSVGFYLQVTTLFGCSIVLLRIASKPTQTSSRSEKL